MAPTTQCPQGSQDPVFDIVKCDVPCIFPIPTDDWLVNPQVPQAPDDIADCPAVPIVLLPRVDTTARANHNGKAEPPPIPSNAANLTPWTKGNFLAGHLPGAPGEGNR